MQNGPVRKLESRDGGVWESRPEHVQYTLCVHLTVADEAISGSEATGKMRLGWGCCGWAVGPGHTGNPGETGQSH